MVRVITFTGNILHDDDTIDLLSDGAGTAVDMTWLNESLYEDWIDFNFSWADNQSLSCVIPLTSPSADELAAALFKALVMTAVIVAAVCGNILVIVSAMRFERLRIIANSFLVSLAVADLLVAVLVMPFNALQQVAGRWLFGPVVCDIFNANDVLFSTASLLHLCCVSVDRYVAVTDPFGYERRMTVRRVVAMLACLWTASALLGHLPIHFGWYREVSDQLSEDCYDVCEFNVNRVYGMCMSLKSSHVYCFNTRIKKTANCTTHNYAIEYKPQNYTTKSTTKCTKKEVKKALLIQSTSIDYLTENTDLKM